MKRVINAYIFGCVKNSYVYSAVGEYGLFRNTNLPREQDHTGLFTICFLQTTHKKVLEAYLDFYHADGHTLKDLCDEEITYHVN